MIRSVNAARGWRAFGASVRGESHRRGGTPNQDALALLREGARGPIVAIADGHGSERSFRSDIGSRIAVRTAVQCLRAFSSSADATSEGLEQRAKTKLATQIVDQWTEQVVADITHRPFMDWELERAGAVSEIEEFPTLAYGATLLVAAVLGRSILLLQIGDGDVLRVSSGVAPKVVRPVPSDPRLIGNETTSLCLPSAAADFRIRVLDRDDPSSELIVMTTDGYANSFVSDDAFLKTGPDILKIVREKGLEHVEENLTSWLEEASRGGSGDDITMGILTPLDSIPTPSVGLPGEVPTAVKTRPSTTEQRRRHSVRLVALASVVALVLGFGVGRAGRHSATPVRNGSRSPSSEGSHAAQWRLPDGRQLTIAGAVTGFGRVWVATKEGLLIVMTPRVGGGVVTEYVCLERELAGIQMTAMRVRVATVNEAEPIDIDPHRLDTVRKSKDCRVSDTSTSSETPSPAVEG